MRSVMKKGTPKLSEQEMIKIKRMAMISKYTGIAAIIAQALIWGSVFHSRNAILISMGIGYIGYGIYWFIGYRLRWRHIYCIHQSFSRIKMTPENCDLDTFPKSEAYGLPAIFAVLGSMLIMIGLFK